MNSDLDFKLNHDADASSKLAEMFFLINGSSVVRHHNYESIFIWKNLLSRKKGSHRWIQDSCPESKIEKKMSGSRKMKRPTAATMQYIPIAESQYVEVFDLSSFFDFLWWKKYPKVKHKPPALK